MKKSLLLLPLMAALSTVSLPAQGADYHVVVPAPGKAAPYAAIKLELSPATLPTGLVGDPFAGFDFNTALRITGDPELDMSQVAWSVYSESLPYGLSLTRDGGLIGTPIEIGKSTFQALAKYKTKTALGTYEINVDDIALALDIALPDTRQREPFHHSLAPQLSASGDPAYAPENVSWSLAEGTLPVGVNLTESGNISGTPTQYGLFPITIEARYKHKTISQAVQLAVAQVIGIREATGTRTWEDGTVAQSCQDYREPVRPYAYVGDTGSGLYRIAPNGQAPFNAYCDMTSDGGGWTRVVLQYEASTVAWTGGASGASYTLAQNKIPAHTHTGFGKDNLATYVDYVQFQYKTGNIAKAVVSSPKTGLSYHIFRSATHHYTYHDPEQNLIATSAGWGNALSIDRVGLLGRDWAFSLLHPNRNERGYAMEGSFFATTNDSFGWSVWVR